MRTRRRTGFTLVELLVVIAIIGILVSLLLPAINSLRESTRMAQCKSNLRTLGQALQLYHEKYNTFPINYGDLGDPDIMYCQQQTMDTGSPNNQGRSWMTALLPYLGEMELYNSLREDLGIYGTNAKGLRPNTIAAQTKLEQFICPSDYTGDGRRDDRDAPGPMANLPLAVTNYNVVSGSNWIFEHEIDTEPTMPLADHYEILSYSGLNPLHLYYRSGRHAFEPNGIDCGNGFLNRGGRVVDVTSQRNFQDGASNILAVGEVLPANNPKKWWYWFDGAVATAALPINFRPKQPPSGSEPSDPGPSDPEPSADDDSEPDLPDDGSGDGTGDDGSGEPSSPGYEDWQSEPPIPEQWQRNYGFQSRHTGGAQFLIADGSVRFLSENIDIKLYRDLANLDSENDPVMPSD